MIRLTEGGPTVTFHAVELERQIATFLSNNSITTQAGWSAAITGLTAAQQTAAVKAILRCLEIT